MANYDTPDLTYDSGVFYDTVPVPQPTTNNMAKAKVKLNLDRLTDDQLLQKAKDIKTAMTGNANFATPSPTLLDMGTRITTADTKLGAFNAAQSAAKQATTEKNTALDNVRTGLRDWATYVQLTSGGAAEKIQSAGMDLKSSLTPTVLPSQVMNLALTAGDNAGEIDAQWDSLSNARTYQVETSPEPMTSSSWTRQKEVTKSKTAIFSLTSGQRVWLRVRAVNPAGEGPWSDVATKIVP